MRYFQFKVAGEFVPAAEALSSPGAVESFIEVVRLGGYEPIPRECFFTEAEFLRQFDVDPALWAPCLELLPGYEWIKFAVSEDCASISVRAGRRWPSIEDARASLKARGDGSPSSRAVYREHSRLLAASLARREAFEGAAVTPAQRELRDDLRRQVWNLRREFREERRYSKVTAPPGSFKGMVLSDGELITVEEHRARCNAWALSRGETVPYPVRSVEVSEVVEELRPSSESDWTRARLRAAARLRKEYPETSWDDVFGVDEDGNPLAYPEGSDAPARLRAQLPGVEAVPPRVARFALPVSADWKPPVCTVPKCVHELSGEPQTRLSCPVAHWSRSENRWIFPPGCLIVRQARARS